MSFVARTGFRALRATPRLAPVQRRFASETAAADKDLSKNYLKQAPKKDPELYVRRRPSMPRACTQADWDI